MEILTDFGVNWSVLLASVVNFVILAVILWFVMAKPLLALMEERETAIRTSLERAELGRQEAATLETQLASQRATAAADAKSLVDDATKRADAIVAKARTDAETKAAHILAAAETKATEERKRLLDEATSQLGEIVVDATRIVVGTHMTPELDAKVVADALKQTNA